MPLWSTYLNRWIQPDEIIPDPGNPQSFGRYAYSFNNPVRFSDPSGHDPWDVVGQFFTGMGAEFTRTSNWMGALASPSVATSLSPTSGETDAMLFGRVAGDVVTIILAAAEVGGGLTIAGGGAAVGCGTTLCLASAPAAVSGLAVASYGVGTSVSGAAGLGENLGRLYSSTDSSGEQYPNVIDPRTGKPIPAPPDNLKTIPQDQRVPWGPNERSTFIKQWYVNGNQTPKGGWAAYDIHHIIPREYGGTNDFDNLVPVLRDTHQQDLNRWLSHYGPR